MKNGNRRGMHDLNNRERHDNPVHVVVSALITVATITLFIWLLAGCKPVQGKRIYSERFQYDNARTVVWENDTALIFTKRGKVIQVVPKKPAK